MTEAIIAALALLGFIYALSRVRSRPRPQRQFTTRRNNPQPGEYWMAFVPNAEGFGGKDRPCLVVRSRGRDWQVAYITSQDKSTDPNYLRLDPQQWSGAVGRAGASYLRISARNHQELLRTVPAQNFRRYLGPASPEVRRHFKM